MKFVFAATQTWWQDLILLVLSLVATILLPALVAYAVALLKKKKVALEFDTVWSLVEKAVMFAEQAWKNALNEGAEPKDKAAKTMQIATDQLGKLLAQWGLPRLAKEKLIDLIEAKVGEINTKPK